MTKPASPSVRRRSTLCPAPDDDRGFELLRKTSCAAHLQEQGRIDTTPSYARRRCSAGSTIWRTRGPPSVRWCLCSEKGIKLVQGCPGEVRSHPHRDAA